MLTSKHVTKKTELSTKLTSLVHKRMGSDVALFDEGRNLMWFPSVLNMGKLGVIYPEGTKDNWVYKLAQVRPLTELEKKDEKYNGHTEMLDVEKAETFGQYEFLEACQKMGIIKELD